MTLSNADCSFAKLGSSTAAILDTATPQINVLAGGQVDGRYLGIQNQNGPRTSCSGSPSGRTARTTPFRRCGSRSNTRTHS